MADPEPQPVGLALARSEHDREERESTELMAQYRPKWPGRALWLSAALFAGATGAWLGPSALTQKPHEVQAAVEPDIGAVQTGALNVNAIAHDAALAPAPQPLPAAVVDDIVRGIDADAAGAQLVSARPRAHDQRGASAEPRQRSSRRHLSSEPPPAPSEPELHGDTVPVPELSLAAAPEPRDLDPQKLLDPFAGE